MSEQTEPKVSQEVADAEFDRFAEAMDLDVDTSRMDTEDVETFKTSRRRVTDAIMRGSLAIDDAGQPVYQPLAGGDAITFYEPTGATFMAMDGKKKDHDFERTFSLLADMTRQLPKRFATMKQRDLKLCRTILGLFLG